MDKAFKLYSPTQENRSHFHVSNFRKDFIIKALFQVYRIFLFPVLQIFGGTRAGCKFEPSCSQYSEAAFNKYGILKGAWLSTKRVLRCNPWTKSFGSDPLI